MSMGLPITFDPAKDIANQTKHGVSLALYGVVLAGAVIGAEDVRYDYGERRFVTFEYVNGRLHVAVWPPARDQDAVRAISVRKAHWKEQQRYG